jgi:hypothetical protein
MKNWAEIIVAVKTPLGLYALIVLLIATAFATLAFRATGFDFTILVVGIFICLLFLIGVGAWIMIKQSVSPRPKEGAVIADVPPAENRYDVFVSSPMAAHANEDEYQLSRQEALKFAACLRTKCKFNPIYYAGLDIATKADFEAADISVEDVLDAVKHSRYFVLIYLSKIVTSSLLETGCALALRKPSVYFVRSRDDLPFLMKKAEQAFPNIVKIHECDNMTAILKLLERHAERLFPSILH